VDAAIRGKAAIFLIQAANVTGKRRLPILILTRRPGETIIIELPTGEQIQVAVLGVKGNQVRIGTQAPDDIQIMREELLEADDN
jgi:carbon storage regulator